ncbi:MAG: hypothetical protein WBB34_03890 [Xanthobacteraceae bacterium]
MMSLLAKPWLRLQSLLAIYAALAIGSTCLFFIVYELAVFLRSFETVAKYVNSPTLLLTLIVTVFLVVPHIVGSFRHRRETQEFVHSPELNASLASSLFATLGFGLYLQKQSKAAQFRRQSLDHMRFMVEHMDVTTLPDAYVEHLRTMKKTLEQPGRLADPEMHDLVTRLLEKCQKARTGDDDNFGGVSDS